MIKKIFATIYIPILILFSSCTEEWLKPNQPSALAPENTFTTVSGLNGLVNEMCKGLRPEVIGRGTNMRRAYEGSDLAVLVNGSPRDYDSEMTPSATWPTDFWNSSYKQISYATIVISHADGVKDANQQKKDEIKSAGYFFLGYWYYRLINTFGDVPLILEETNYPKLDFKTSTRDRIIRNIIPLLEFAVEKLPLTASSGQVNRAAGYMLLTKYYLMDGQFDKAVNSATAVIEYPGLKLMTTRFGALLTTVNPKIPNPNVMTDLFYKYNPSDPANTEKILVVQDYPIINGSTTGSERMREHLVEWYTNNMDNNQGTSTIGTGSGNVSVVDGGTGGPGPLGLSVGLQILWTGRGIGEEKKTWYFHHDVWADPAFKNDMRHSAPNWYPMEFLLYNRPGANVYGKNLIQANCRDTLRSWDCIVYNKTVVDDENRLATNYNLMGGSMDWYIYRLAEVYLMRAEALVWLNRGDEAKNDINVIRSRAGASPMTTTATLDDVLDERARELFLEEMRKQELVRISYTMAKLNMNGYTIDNMGTKNWFYDRMINKNNLYFDLSTKQKRQFTYNGRIYNMSPYHIYWPIPESAINDNTLAHINQNYGYVGYENNIAPENN
jgi:hypothetical protein